MPIQRLSNSQKAAGAVGVFSLLACALYSRRIPMSVAIKTALGLIALYSISQYWKKPALTGVVQDAQLLSTPNTSPFASPTSLVKESPCAEMLRLYPPEIIQAVGGAERMMKFQCRPITPDDVTSMECRFQPSNPTIRRGKDQMELPFLEIYCPGFSPIIYYSSSSANVLDVNYWMKRRPGEQNLESISERDIIYLSQIAMETLITRVPIGTNLATNT